LLLLYRYYYERAHEARATTWYVILLVAGREEGSAHLMPIVLVETIRPHYLILCFGKAGRWLQRLLVLLYFASPHSSSSSGSSSSY
jgi:hypothetical protein